MCHFICYKCVISSVIDVSFHLLLMCNSSFHISHMCHSSFHISQMCHFNFQDCRLTIVLPWQLFIQCLQRLVWANKMAEYQTVWRWSVTQILTMAMYYVVCTCVVCICVVCTCMVCICLLCTCVVCTYEVCTCVVCTCVVSTCVCYLQRRRLTHSMLRWVLGDHIVCMLTVWTHWQRITVMLWCTHYPRIITHKTA